MNEFLFEDFRSSILKDFELNHWTTIYLLKTTNNDTYTCSGVLFPDSLKNNFLSHAQPLDVLEFTPDFVHEHSKKPKYRRWGIDSKYEPIVYRRFFNGIHPTTVAVVEELICFFNAYYDPKSKCYISVDRFSVTEEIIKSSDEEIKIKTSKLREFLAAKEMSLGIQFMHTRYVGGTIYDHNLTLTDEIKDSGSDYTYLINFQKCDWFNDKTRAINSRFYGKKILKRYSNHSPKTDWERSKEKKHLDFIISLDSDSGEKEYFSSNPDKLNDRFNNKPNAPSYFQPIFFNKPVLLKYYSDPKKFEVNDGDVNFIGSWRLRIDNNNENYVVAYLGDLGRDLPFEEQKYWGSFNVPPDGSISEVKKSRDFSAVWMEPTSLDLVFKNRLQELDKIWNEKNGFKLLKDFNPEDEHCLSSLRIPLLDSQGEFDQQVLNLTKILVDNINEKKILKLIVKPENINDRDFRGIDKLEVLLGAFLKRENKTIPFLRSLQSLRSKGPAHRKGSDYNKILDKLGINGMTHVDAFKLIMRGAVEVLEELKEVNLKSKEVY